MNKLKVNHSIFLITLSLLAFLTLVDIPSTFAADGAIRGETYNDLNKDGKQNAGEPTFGDVTVYLDIDNDGILDENEPSTVTRPSGSATGIYWFLDLETETVIVRVITPVGGVVTEPEIGYYTIEVSPKTKDLEFNFGITFIDVPVIDTIEEAKKQYQAAQQGTIQKETEEIEKFEPKKVEESSSVEGGGCLIATATYGSELSTQVQQLRELRDETILNTKSGTVFMSGFNQLYYSFSPTIADLEREHPIFKETVKIFITPILTSLSILHYLDIDSEEKMLVYGIGVILLNAGMYFLGPATIIYGLKKSSKKNFLFNKKQS